jgi:hypothetical protein
LGFFQAKKTSGKQSDIDAMHAIQTAAVDAIKTMDDHLHAIDFNLSEMINAGLVKLLSSFDAIFTLNQDTLLERKYVYSDLAPFLNSGWTGGELPGVPANVEQTPYGLVAKKTEVASQPVRYQKTKTQPVFKLHGSWNWINPDATDLVIMGGQKSVAIATSPLLKSYHSIFAECLRSDSSKLMIIGYGFGDPHINSAIEQACKRDLELFIIDPKGYDLLGGSSGPSGSISAMERALVGSSRRSLREIFNPDEVEFSKLADFMRS